ncbi:hypothetical protein GNI_099810 [Gregarina niphandrodes]|uniref:Uncharacterized protein n=1 Tax=Gregarina niphandrodes TaxID=110365 RepID=A0A023B4M2_GRENI|nr:hypothetical protein GNI_099810 [Gregarina niphandrodes]EZG57005.1 hypothetical protein GNI_099810 [Gregarina niphandrodes]|eukprot:XP_011131117.1 hypothetical protein GNI_099810 [Gregarina niphandrodes]
MGSVPPAVPLLLQYDLKFSCIPGDNNYVADALSRLQDDEDHDRDLDATHIGNRPFAVHFAEVSQNLFQLPSRNEFLVKDDDVPVDELQNLLKREDGPYEHRKTKKLYVPNRLS